MANFYTTKHDYSQYCRFVRYFTNQNKKLPCIMYPYIFEMYALSSPKRSNLQRRNAPSTINLSSSVLPAAFEWCYQWYSVAVSSCHTGGKLARKDPQVTSLRTRVQKTSRLTPEPAEQPGRSQLTAVDSTTEKSTQVQTLQRTIDIHRP